MGYPVSDADHYDSASAGHSEDETADTENGVLSPGSTATGSGTGDIADDVMDLGTTDADVSDGREQKQA
jgi:hypothetical protein